jgi:hypothetical protein
MLVEAGAAIDPGWLQSEGVRSDPSMLAALTSQQASQRIGPELCSRSNRARVAFIKQGRAFSGSAEYKPRCFAGTRQTPP